MLDKIKQIMKTDGLNPKHIGFEYLAMAIEMYEPGTTFSAIYKQIAKECYVTCPQASMCNAVHHKALERKFGRNIKVSTYIMDVKRRIGN